MASIEQLVKRQLDRWSIETRAIEESRQPNQKLTVHPFIAFSRQRGADGLTIAKKVGERLGWQVLSRELADYVAQDLQINRRIMESVDERVQSATDNYLRSVLMGNHPSEREYAQHLGRVLHVFLRHDPAIIMGRGANILLRDLCRYGLRVHLVAPIEWRVQHLVKTEGMTETEARSEIQRCDTDRDHFIRAAFSQNISDPLVHDITLNREHLPLEQTVEIILGTLRLKGITEKT